MMPPMIRLIAVLTVLAIGASVEELLDGEAPSPVGVSRDSYTTEPKPEAVASMMVHFKDKATMNDLRHLLPRCVNGEDLQDVGMSGLSCSQILYLLDVQKYRSGFRPKEGKDDIVRKAPTISDFTEGQEGAEGSSEYSSLFEKVIATTKTAFKGTLNAQIESGFTLPPCEGATENKVALDVPLRDCSNYDMLQDRLIVPRILANNYLHKLNPALSNSFTFTANDLYRTKRTHD